MSYIQKRNGNYRARFTDPLGRVQSRTFTRKADAERFLRELDRDKVKGQWVDPRDSDIPIAVWATDFLRLCRRLAPTTQINVTLDRYGHLFPELDEAIADAFDREIAEAQRRLAATVVHAAFGST